MLCHVLIISKCTILSVIVLSQLTHNKVMRQKEFKFGIGTPDSPTVRRAEGALDVLVLLTEVVDVPFLEAVDRDGAAWDFGTDSVDV